MRLEVLVRRVFWRKPFKKLVILKFSNIICLSQRLKATITCICICATQTHINMNLNEHSTYYGNMMTPFLMAVMSKLRTGDFAKTRFQTMFTIHLISVELYRYKRPCTMYTSSCGKVAEIRYVVVSSLSDQKSQTHYSNRFGAIGSFNFSNSWDTWNVA